MMPRILFALFLLPVFFSPAHAQDPRWIEVQKIVASDGNHGGYFNHHFGASAAISGNYAIVGAPSESEDTSRSTYPHAHGAAYIFERDENGTWNEVQKIVASDREPRAFFGSAVSISEEYALVGASGNEAVYVFMRRADGVWAETQKIAASDGESESYFGSSLSVSGDVAIVGDSGNDTDDTTGNDLGNAGAAYIFKRDGNGRWVEIQKIVASDRTRGSVFGHDVSISGNIAIVGAHNCPTDAAGKDSVRYAGAAYIFERDGNGTWLQTRKVTAADREKNAQFGIAVSVSGNYAVVGVLGEDLGASPDDSVRDAGAAYVFERNENGTWNRRQKIVASDREVGDRFGGSVSLSGEYAIVGAYNDDDTLDQQAGMGSAYIFKRSEDGTWNQAQKIFAADRGTYDHFGVSVAIDDKVAVAGAQGKANTTFGGHPQHDSGSAYIFELSSTTGVINTPPNAILSFHPNPTDRTLHIDLGGMLHSSVSITIRDLLGRTIIDQTFNATEAINLDIDGPGGVYLATVRTREGGTTTLKIVKK